MSEYIGNRIVPRHDGVWDKAKEYEPLTIVYEEATGDSYLSRKPVPAGTLLSQEEYWAMCSRFSEQMALYRQNTAADVATLRKMTAQDVADITQKVDAANSAVVASKSEMDKTAETLKAQINANVKALKAIRNGMQSVCTQITASPVHPEKREPDSADCSGTAKREKSTALCASPFPVLHGTRQISWKHWMPCMTAV